jgi:hypothetical protein
VSSTPRLPLFSWVESINNKEEYMVLENRVLGRIFGFKRKEVTGRWRGAS